MDSIVSEGYLTSLTKIGENQIILDGYIDADMAGDTDSRKSTSGYLMIFAGGGVSS